MSSPFEMFGSQDLKDDDGQVIDSLLIETDAPPDPAKGEMSFDKPAPTLPKIPTRLLTGYQNFTATTDPIMILPADPSRKSVTLTVFSAAAAPTASVEYLSISDESGKLNTTSAMNLRHGKDPIALDHSGPIFAKGASTLTAVMELTWVAVYDA